VCLQLSLILFTTKSEGMLKIRVRLRIRLDLRWAFLGFLGYRGNFTPEV
jgi:hypothetical protein